MNILILSPYDAASHQYWWKGLVEHFSEHNCTVVTLPPRYFSWRFRGNSLTLSFDERLQGSFDLVIATSMTDLSALKGLCPNIALTPSILYFHENQFAYPDKSARHHQIERQMTSLYAAISADQLVFNSEFNRESFLTGVSKLLKRLPDGIPKGIVDILSAKSHVISVALKPQLLPKKLQHKNLSSREKVPVQKVNIIWNHRWEYDKGLEDLETLISMLIDSDLDFTFHLIGQSFRKIPDAVQRSLDLLIENNKLGESGFIESRDDYLDLLANNQIVLSTALHEFQGLAVLEAIQVGNIPIVPDALAYKEFVPKAYRYSNLEHALELLKHYAAATEHPELPKEVIESFVIQKWDVLLQSFS